MKRFLCTLLLMVMIPYVTTLAWTGRTEGEEWIWEEYHTEDGPAVVVERNGTETPVSVEEFLIGVLAGQIPAGYGKETIKAQSVLARTYIYRELNGGDRIPEEALDIDCLSRSQMEELWGESGFAGTYGAMREAIQETEGETLFWENDWIVPFFCRAAAGKTRNGGEEYPYLRPAESPGDLQAEGFLSQTMWTPEEMAEKLSKIPGGKTVEAGSLPEEIQIVERDESGYVTSIQIGGNLYSGEEVQYALSLPSSCYSLEEMEGKIRVTCKGIGHGYGFSQAGADALEKEGMDYRELLSYFFQNVEIRERDAES